MLWRKRRLRLAENACHHHALRAACANTSNSAAAALVLTGAPARKVDIASTLTGTAEEIRTEIRELSEDEAMTNRALERLESGAPEPAMSRVAASSERLLRRRVPCCAREPLWGPPGACSVFFVRALMPHLRPVT